MVTVLPNEFCATKDRMIKIFNLLFVVFFFFVCLCDKHKELDSLLFFYQTKQKKKWKRIFSQKYNQPISFWQQIHNKRTARHNGMVYNA